MEMMKTCNRCGETKAATTDFFVADKRLKCGVRAICKECNRVYRLENKESIKEYYQNNKEKIYENKKEYYKNNVDSILEYKKERYSKNSDRFLEWQKEYYEKNKDRIKEYRENNKDRIAEVNKIYRKKNHERISERERLYVANRIKENKELRILRRCRGRMNRVIKGRTKSASSLELLGCTSEYLVKHLENQFADGMTWDNYGEWHIDHIRPCASFDFNNKEDQRICFNYKNLQPLWAKDNLKKGSKINELL